MPQMNTKTTSEKSKFGSNKTLGFFESACAGICRYRWALPTTFRSDWFHFGFPCRRVQILILDWEQFRKKISQKNRKNSKNQGEIAACEQKTTNEKANYCSSTVFSLYFKIRAKQFHAEKPLAFSLHFLFRRDQNHHSNLTSKILKMCEHILKKKDSAPIQFKFFEL